MARKVKIICICLMILYIITRMPFPLLVIPLVGCTIVWVNNEIKEIKDEKQSKKKKKVTKKSTKSNS